MMILNTAIYAAVLGLLLLFLSALVSRTRRQHKIALGYGDRPEMLRVIRAHANFVEYVPMALILLLSVELLAYRAWVVHALGVALVVGRLLHAWGILTREGANVGRSGGTVLTWGTILVASLLVLIGALSGFTTSFE